MCACLIEIIAARCQKRVSEPRIVSLHGAQVGFSAAAAARLLCVGAQVTQYRLSVASPRVPGCGAERVLKLNECIYIGMRVLHHTS